MNERTPIHCILPPHMLKEIMERGSPSQRSWALRTLVASEQLRGRREALGAAAAALVPAGTKRRTIYDAKGKQELPGVLVRGEGDPPADEARRLEAMLEQAALSSLPERGAEPPSGADRFHYRIVVETEGRAHTIEMGESALPTSLRPLIEWLTQAARKSRGGGPR